MQAARRDTSGELRKARVEACERFAEEVIAKVLSSAGRPRVILPVMPNLKLGLQLGYWGSQPPPHAASSPSRLTASDTTLSGPPRPTAPTP